MSTTTFVDGSTRTSAAWFQAVNDLIYLLFGVTDGVTHTAAMARAALKTGGFLTSVAGTNTITATAAIAPAAYAAGDSYILIPANANTGATTVNLNSLGAKNLFSEGAACVGGELAANVPVMIVYDGTQFNILRRSAATQSDQETATSTTKFVSPGRQQFHPSAAKAWVVANFSGGVANSYNVTSITDGGAGLISVTWATDFSSVAYAAEVSVESASPWIPTVDSSTRLAGSCDFRNQDSTGTEGEADAWHIVAYGDQ